jgi:putative tryptophan/tyrosine transport system substrate-binding protein
MWSVSKMRNFQFLALFMLAVSINNLDAMAVEKKRILGVFYEGCEKTCEGFKAGIEKSGLSAEVTIFDVKQDKERLLEAIELARKSRPDLIVTYGTTTTLAFVGTLETAKDPKFINDVPVVFTAVADPFGTRIAESFERSGRDNITGTFNRVPERVNIETIRQYDRKFSKLGLLYNGNEKNSMLKRDELEKLAAEMNFELVALEIDPGNPAVPDPSLIPLRVKQLAEQEVKWAYLGSSSFLNANGAAFTAAAVDNGIGLLSPYEALVREQQALISIAAPRESVGLLAAQQAVRILRDGKKPGKLPISRATAFSYLVNMKVAERLGRKPPFAFYSDTELVQQ